MDNFNKMYIKIIESLNSSILSIDNGIHGNDLKMSDFWNTNDFRIASTPKKPKKRRKNKKII